MHIRISKSCSSACLDKVAIMSSASNPGISKCLIPNPSTNSFMKESWDLNSSGVAERFALYSGNFSDLKVLRDTSKATAI
ncbi:unannotated protein [freshwater metagenome]|uniref:Unannotated protein n=1 Tax=freshwater metagenome TaxID=449393 RepID=A0A6J7CXB3_9ZZZZ